jgi:hypothetical protein
VGALGFGLFVVGLTLLLVGGVGKWAEPLREAREADPAASENWLGYFMPRPDLLLKIALGLTVVGVLLMFVGSLL